MPAFNSVQLCVHEHSISLRGPELPPEASLLQCQFDFYSLDLRPDRTTGCFNVICLFTLGGGFQAQLFVFVLVFIFCATDLRADGAG